MEHFAGIDLHSSNSYIEITVTVFYPGVLPSVML